MANTGLHRDPAQGSELLNNGGAAKAPITGSFDSSNRHLGFIVNGWTVDVANTAFHTGSHVPCSRNVAAEDGGREAVFGIVRDAKGFLVAVDTNHSDDRAKGFLGIDTHGGSYMVEHGSLHEGSFAV